MTLLSRFLLASFTPLVLAVRNGWAGLVVVWRRRCVGARGQNCWACWGLAALVYAGAVAGAPVAPWEAFNSAKDAPMQLAQTQHSPAGRLDDSDRYGQRLADTVPAIEATAQSPSGPHGMLLETTLDATVQKQAQDALRAGLAAYKAIGGTAVVIDVASGEIRAMVSTPDFDLNDTSTYSNPYQPGSMVNRAVAVSFPAAGLFTPLLVAQGIESGRFSPSHRVALGNGSLKVGTYVVRDADLQGGNVLSITQVVAKASNVGLAKLALQIPLLELEAISRSMGLGEPLAIPGLMGGVTHTPIPWKEWSPMMQAAPGLYIETNLMQVMRAYMPIAGDGVLRTPTMLKQGASRDAGLQVLSPATVAQMRAILQQVTSPTGTAHKAQVLGLSVAGKTATVTKFGGGRPAVAAFVGMTPAERPQWLVGVLLQFPPAAVRYSGDTAAPVFASIVQGLARGHK